MSGTFSSWRARVLSLIAVDIKPNLDEQPRSTNLTDFDEAAMYESDHSTDSSDDDTANLKEGRPISFRIIM